MDWTNFPRDAELDLRKQVDRRTFCLTPSVANNEMNLRGRERKIQSEKWRENVVPVLIESSRHILSRGIQCESVENLRILADIGADCNPGQEVILSSRTKQSLQHKFDVKDAPRRRLQKQ